MPVTLSGRRARRVGAELRPGTGSEDPRRTADGDEADSIRAGPDPAELVRSDTGHRSRAQLELTVVRDQGRRPAERDVDLLLIRVERVAAVIVVGIVLPAWGQREDL